MLEQKVKDDAVEAGGVDGVVGQMARFGLDVRLVVGRAAEILAERLVEHARAVAAADDGVVLARGDERGTLEPRRVDVQKGRVDGEGFADGERLLGGLVDLGRGAVVRAEFELGEPREDVHRRHVAVVKGREAERPLRAGDPRRERRPAVLRVAGENGGVGEVWFLR